MLKLLEQQHTFGSPRVPVGERLVFCLQLMRSGAARESAQEVLTDDGYGM